jgi:hypothetical protein
VLDLALIVIMQDFLHMYLVFDLNLLILGKSWPKGTVNEILVLR